MAARFKNSILTIANDKGGCTKTSIAVNLSSCFAQMDHKTVLFDTDPQGNASLYLGYEDEYDNPNGRNLFNAIKNEVSLDNIIVETKYENLYLVPSCSKLRDLKTDLAGSGREYEVFDYLIRDSKFMVDTENTLFDTHPDFDIYTIAALKCSHYYTIPIVPDLFSSAGLKKQILMTEKIRKYQNPMLTFLGIIISRFKKKNRAHLDFRDDLFEVAKQVKGMKILNTAIPESEAIPTSINLRTPINHYSNAKSGPVGAAFMALAGELMPELRGQRKGRKLLPIDTDKVPDGIILSELENNSSIQPGLILQ